jgi:hypothetical protein
VFFVTTKALFLLILAGLLSAIASVLVYAATKAKEEAGKQ